MADFLLHCDMGEAAANQELCMAWRRFRQ